MKKFFIFFLLLIVLGSFYFFWLYPRYAVPILMYHSFDYSRGLLSVSPENFEKQMRIIKEGGYHVIPLDEAVDGMRKKREFPHNTVVITIDDGYQNSYTVAYPLLKKYGFPATIFLITDMMDTGKSFFARDGYLTWDEVREMSHHGILFGSHTKRHVYLPAMKSQEILWDEIAGSKEIIEKNIGKPIYYFCYPLGGFTEEIQRLVEKAGYKGACATNRGYDLLNRKKFYEINRISVRNANPALSINNKNWWSGLRFRVKLLGYYYSFRIGKNGY